MCERRTTIAKDRQRIEQLEAELAKAQSDLLAQQHDDATRIEQLEADIEEFKSRICDQQEEYTQKKFLEEDNTKLRVRIEQLEAYIVGEKANHNLSEQAAMRRIEQLEDDLKLYRVAAANYQLSHAEQQARIEQLEEKLASTYEDAARIAETAEVMCEHGCNELIANAIRARLIPAPHSN